MRKVLCTHNVIPLHVRGSAARKRGRQPHAGRYPWSAGKPAIDPSPYLVRGIRIGPWRVIVRETLLGCDAPAPSGSLLRLGR